MSLKPFAFSALLIGALTLPGIADETGALRIVDAYARAASPNAKAGAAFLVIENPTGSDDRLISATSDVAMRVELHTHIDAGNGVMQMRHDQDGFPIPAGEQHTLQRGGDHIMFMGLNRALRHGETVDVTLTFEQAGDILIEIPIDLER